MAQSEEANTASWWWTHPQTGRGERLLLAKIYNEAKKVSWFDQQNGRTYLKYLVKALVQNDTLLQVKGVGANGSFGINKKLEGLAVPPKKSSKPAAKKTASTPKAATTAAAKKAKPSATKTSTKPTAKSPKKN